MSIKPAITPIELKPPKGFEDYVELEVLLSTMPTGTKLYKGKRYYMASLNTNWTSYIYVSAEGDTALDALKALKEKLNDRPSD